MSNTSKVVWSEGIFLSPHHFQQQERYLEQVINDRCQAIHAYGWGVSQLVIDQPLLSLGKVVVNQTKGVFPDGTAFSTLESNSSGIALDIPPNIHNQELFLAIPLKRSGLLEVQHTPHTPQSESTSRYQLTEHQAWDTESEMGEMASVQVGKLNLRLLLESDDLSGYACIGIARIKERRENKLVVLDDEYIPSCLDIQVSHHFKSLLTELTGLLHHRATALSERLAESGRAGAAEIADYLLLQLLNRIEPLVKHLNAIDGLHPERLYTELLQMAGELASFSSGHKRPTPLPTYLHAHLQETFAPLIQSLRQQLSSVIERSAIAINWTERKYGIRVATIQDRTLLSSAQFIVAVKADTPSERLRRQFPAHAKLGSVENIRELVNAQMPGITLHPLPVAPRQIPYHSGYLYFEINQNSDYWKSLSTSGGLAMHIGTEYPGLELELWAIRA